MDETENYKPPPEQDALLCEIRDAVTGIADDLHKIQGSMDDFMDYVNDLKSERNRVVDNIPLRKEQVLEFLNVSASTLQVWRNKGLIKCRKQNIRTIIYDYKQIVEALKSGKLMARGFDPDVALMRMRKWYEGTYKVIYLNNEFMQK